MRNSKIIKIGTKEITVRELSVREIDGLFGEYRDSDYVPHTLDLLIDKPVTFKVVLLCIGQKEEELLDEDITPSAIIPLYDAVIELNPSLAALGEKAGAMAAGVIRKG
jgi:hypothetical protein